MKKALALSIKLHIRANFLSASGGIGRVYIQSFLFMAEIMSLIHIKKINLNSRINNSTHFKCLKCKDIFSINDKFNDDLKENQMCKL